MITRLVLTLVLGLSALPAAAAPSAGPAAVVAAERAFAADGLKLGVRDAFLKHSAPEGILLQPDPVLAKAVLQTWPASGPPLTWWPLWAGIAQSGDLGFTTGPYAVDGKPRAWYFTVWARQPDGGWKWLYDGGPPADPTGTAAAGGAVAYARAAERQAGSSAKAMAEVSKAEAVLAAAAATDVKAAFLAQVATDGRILGSKAKPPTDRAALEAELASRASSIKFSPLGGQASSAGDLAWTYGHANWTAEGKPARGHYVRIWRNDKAGWRLLYDQLLAAPPAVAPPTS